MKDQVNITMVALSKTIEQEASRKKVLALLYTTPIIPVSISFTTPSSYGIKKRRNFNKTKIGITSNAILFHKPTLKNGSF
jgi:hypothetical protein